MSLTEEERKTLVLIQYEKALKNLKQAEEMLALKYYDMSANRFYYACFHALQALLLKNGIECHTHAGTLAEFGRNFIRTGIIEPQYGKFVTRLEQTRETGDYNCYYEVDETDVIDMVSPAQNLIAIIGKLIDK